MIIRIAYQQEFSAALEIIGKAVDKLSSIASDWSHCPETDAEIQAARASSPTPASDIAALREKADAFDRIAAARGKYVEATATYNARLELVQAERNRGNWSLKTDPEYRDMCDAQKAFIVSAQSETDAALQHVAKGEQ